MRRKKGEEKRRVVGGSPSPFVVPPGELCVLVGIQPSDCAGRFHDSFSLVSTISIEFSFCRLTLHVIVSVPHFSWVSFYVLSLVLCECTGTLVTLLLQLLCSLRHAVPRFLLFAPVLCRPRERLGECAHFDELNNSDTLPGPNPKIRPTGHLHLLLKENWTTIRKTDNETVGHSDSESVGHCHCYASSFSNVFKLTLNSIEEKLIRRSSSVTLSSIAKLKFRCQFPSSVTTNW